LFSSRRAPPSPREAMTAGRLFPLELPRIESPTARLAIGLALVGFATLGRIGLGGIDPRGAPYALYFPAILLAAFLGGWRVGAAAAVISIALAYVLFVTARVGLFHPTYVMLLNVALNSAAFAVVVAVAGRAGALIEGLAQSRQALREQNRRYDDLFSMMSEGFAVCEAIRDDHGRLIDYVVLEMNPALRKMLGVGPEVIGGKLSAAPGDKTLWLKLCDHVLTTGTASSFEFYNAWTKRWHEIHISRVAPTQLAQLFFDITERKTAEEYTARQFDELNHRIKNNLAVVSAILSMQARAAEPATRANLMKAVDRVNSIAHVHQSLSHGREKGMVDFAAYLSGLCDRLQNALTEGGRVRIVVEAQPMDIEAERAVPLGMVVNELVTNGVKYAYPPLQEGEITVRLQTTDTGPVLTVSDVGVGLPNGVETKSDGLGFPIVQSMVRQVGGTLTIRREAGTSFEITLPSASPAGG